MARSSYKVNKCDTCRLRKIKCDLHQPICSQCAIKGRPCSYGITRTPTPEFDEAAKQHSSIGMNGEPSLRVVGRRSVKTGAFYHTLALTKARDDIFRASSSPPRSPSSESELLLARWSRMLDETMHGAQFDIASFLLKEVATRLGSHDVLNAAVAYFLDSYSAFKTSDPIQIYTARKGGVNAVAALRDTLSTQLRRNEEAVMVSMSLHMAAEYFREHFANTLIHLHSRGLGELLKARRAQGRSTEFDMILLRAVCFEEFSRAVFDDCPSTLDSGLKPLLKPVCSLSDAFDVDTISTHVMFHILRLPRLINLVRRCESQTGDFALAEDALRLAKTLYEFRIKPLSIRSMASPATDQDESLDGNITCLDSWLFFQSMTDYNLAIHYYTYRLIISAILQRLLRLLNPSSYRGIPFSQVVLEELSMAENIAKCSKYALSQGSNPSWMALRMSLPVQASYGTWHRLQNGCAVNECDVVVDPEKAACMKRFCVQFSARVQGLENQDTAELERHLANFSEMIIGGPLVTNMEAKVESLRWRFRQYKDGRGF